MVLTHIVEQYPQFATLLEEEAEAFREEAFALLPQTTADTDMSQVSG